MPRKLLFSVTASDCEWQDQTASGPGGQHRNRVHTAIRCTHRASGAVGFASELKSQRQNRERAFARMAETTTFKAWHRLRVSELLGATKRAEEAVEIALRPHNLRVEVRGDDGLWHEAADRG